MKMEMHGINPAGIVKVLDVNISIQDIIVLFSNK